MSCGRRDSLLSFTCTIQTMQSDIALEDLMQEIYPDVIELFLALWKYQERGGDYKNILFELDLATRANFYEPLEEFIFAGTPDDADTKINVLLSKYSLKLPTSLDGLPR